MSSWLKDILLSACLILSCVISRFVEAKLRYIKKIEKETNIYIFFYFTGKLNIYAASELLRTSNCISSDVILLFDEIYLQKCEEYFGGESFGTDEIGNLHKGMTTFTIIGLTRKTFHM